MVAVVASAYAPPSAAASAAARPGSVGRRLIPPLAGNMINTIIALLLASSASAFKPSKAFLGFAGLASASKYDPKIFEDASAAKDALPIDQGERQLLYPGVR